MKYIALTVIAAFATVATSLAVIARPAQADDEGGVERDEGNIFSRLLLASSRGDGDDFSSGSLPAAPASSPYAKECGACHMAYPAGLLPADSWRRMMGQLADHFGENAELDDAERAVITGYLVAHASSRGAGAPLRVTEMRWFVRKHDEVPRRRVVDNPAVRSYANCDACHRDAASGDFDEDRVRIP